MSPETVVITGAAGYLGSRIMRRLHEQGYRVLGLDVRSAPSPAAGAAEPRVLFGDITRPETLPPQVREASALVHCAALAHRRPGDVSRADHFRVNLEGTRNILQALDPARLRRIVFLSTISVYGLQDPSAPVSETACPAPTDAYGESKLAAEEEVRRYSQEKNVPHTTFRLTPVYGRDFLRNIDKRVHLPKRVAFYKVGAGEQRISMCAADNVVHAVSESLRTGRGLDGTFNLKDREDYSIGEIIAAVRGPAARPRRLVLRIPGFPLAPVVSGLMRRDPKRGRHFVHQLSKVVLGARFSGKKLEAAGVRLPMDLSLEIRDPSRF